MRASQKVLEGLLDLVVRMGVLPSGHGSWALDNYAPSGFKYRYALVLVDDEHHGQRRYFDERFTAQEMRALLKGLLLAGDVKRWL